MDSRMNNGSLNYYINTCLIVNALINIYGETKSNSLLKKYYCGFEIN